LLDKPSCLRLIRSDSQALYDAAERDLRRPVPSCPGWYMADLVMHIGGVHRAQAAIVGEKAQEPQGLRREMLSQVPGLREWFERSMDGETDLSAIPPGLLPWARESSRLVESALRAADPKEHVWSWSGVQAVSHYLQLMPIETAVHRWDAQSAVGRPGPIDERLAAEGVEHTFGFMVPLRRQIRGAPPGRGETYHFVDSGSNRSYTVRFDEDNVQILQSAKGSHVTLSGSAQDLFLFLWHRIPAASLHIEGDTSMVDRYFELAPPL